MLTNQDNSRKAKSPYQRYGKIPYRYSELHTRWRAAVIAGRKDEAERLGREHTKRFLPTFTNSAAA